MERARFTSESSTFVKNANVPRKVRGNRNRIDFFIYSILQNFPNNDRAIRSRIFITYDTGGFVQRASIVAIRIHEAFTFEEGKINGFDGRRRFLRGQVPLRAIRLPRKRYRRWCCCNKRGTRKNSIKKKKTINPSSLLFPFHNLRILPPFYLFLPSNFFQISVRNIRSAATRHRDRGATRHGIILCAIATEGGGTTRATTEGRRHLFLATLGKRTGGKRRGRWKSCWRTRWTREYAPIPARAACTRFTNGRGIIRGTRSWPRSTRSNWRGQIRRAVGNSWSGRICGSTRCSAIDRRIISAPARARRRQSLAASSHTTTCPITRVTRTRSTRFLGRGTARRRTNGQCVYEARPTCSISIIVG